MDCETFLSGYSEYRDGLLSMEDRVVFDSHRARCPSCERYDRVVRQGVDLARSATEAESSYDFAERLRHRLYHVEDGDRLSASRLGGSAALVGVAAVGLLALFWLPFAASVPVELHLPAVAVETPPAASEVPALFRSDPLLANMGGVRTSPLLGGHLEWPPRQHVHPTILIGDATSSARSTAR